jgi:pimeloyl-ACP methyl ester carboxylesterase
MYPTPDHDPVNNYVDILSIPIRPEEDIDIGALVGPRGSKIDFSSPFVVYFPGLTASKHYFETTLTSPLLDRFIGLAIDPPGIGDSTLLHPDIYSYRIEQQAVLVNEALDFFVERGLVSSLTFVAHSWGEALALETLRQNKRNLSRFVSVAGGVTGGQIENSEQFLSEDLIDAFLPSMLQQTREAFTGEPSPKEKTLARRILRESISSFIEERDTLAQIFHNLECPKYFVCGIDDSCQGVEGFNKKFFIPSTGHNLVIEESEKFNKVLAQILG